MTDERGAGPTEPRSIGLTRNHVAVGIGCAAAVALGWVFLHGQQQSKPKDRAEVLKVQPVARFEPAPNPIIPAVARVPVALPPAPAPVVALPPAEAARPANDAMMKARHAPLLAGAGAQTQKPASVVETPAQQQEHQTELAQRLTPTKVTAVSATVLAHQPYLLTRGTQIQCVMLTAIDTTLPGPISCRLPQDVLGKTGLVLLDRGTIVTGETGGNMRQGQARVFALWSRAETPQGVVIDLNSPGADSVGRAGFDGAVETHAGARILNSVLVSLVSSGLQVASAGVPVNTGGTANAMEDAARGSVNIQPTLRMNQGDSVSISVVRDLDFAGVYSLAVR